MYDYQNVRMRTWRLDGRSSLEVLDSETPTSSATSYCDIVVMEVGASFGHFWQCFHRKMGGKGHWTEGAFLPFQARLCLAWATFLLAATGPLIMQAPYQSKIVFVLG